MLGPSEGITRLNHPLPLGMAKSGRTLNHSNVTTLEHQSFTSELMLAGMVMHIRIRNNQQDCDDIIGNQLVIEEWPLQQEETDGAYATESWQ